MPGINEKIFYAHNPLPKIPEDALFRKASLDMEHAGEPIPFAIFWQYGGGLGAERMVLNPGDFHPLRESEAVEFDREFGEVGMVTVLDPRDEEEVRLKSLEGLRRAHVFYTDRGTKRIQELRKVHGYSKDDMEDFRYDYWVYYFNQAKADLIKETMKRLRKA